VSLGGSKSSAHRGVASAHAARSRTVDQPCVTGTRSGLKTEPCGTPHPMTVERDVEPPRPMRCVYGLTGRMTALPVIPNDHRKRSNRIWWSTRRYQTPQRGPRGPVRARSPRSTAAKMSDGTCRRAVSVECPERKLDRGPSDGIAVGSLQDTSGADEQLERPRKNSQVGALYQTRVPGIPPRPPPLNSLVAVAVFTCGILRYSNREPHVVMINDSDVSYYCLKN
jgi:hypothetical protein